MSVKKSLSLKVKIISGFLILNILTLIIIGTMFISFTQITKITGELDSNSQVLVHVGELIILLGNAKDSVINYIFTEDNDYQEEFEEIRLDISDKYEDTLNLTLTDKEMIVIEESRLILDETYIITESIFNTDTFFVMNKKERQELVEDFQYEFESVIDEMKDVFKFTKKGNAQITEQADTITHTLKLVSITLITILLLSSIIIIISIWRGLQKKLNGLRSMMEEISQGEADLTHRLHIHSQDELGQTAGFFNKFMDKLVIIIQQVKNSIIHSNKETVNLMVIAQDSLKSISTINEGIENVQTQTDNLDESINNSIQYSNEVKEYITKVSSEINDQTAEITESSTAIEEMAASLINIANTVDQKMSMIENLQDIAGKGQQEMDRTLEIIVNITKAAGGIKSLLNVIKNIANQTNLLAMNAAIEAAHAGEVGRGFSVVADEIRNLAQNTAHNSKQINETLQEISNYISTSKESADTTGEYFKGIVTGINDVGTGMLEIKNAMQELKIGSGQITQALTSLNDHSQGVTDSAGVMTTKIVQLHETFNDISIISTSNRENVNKVTFSVSELYKLIQSLDEEIIENKQNMHKIEEAVVAFNTD